MKEKIISSYKLIVSKAYTLVTEKEVVIQSHANTRYDDFIQLNALKRMRSNLKTAIKHFEDKLDKNG